MAKNKGCVLQVRVEKDAAAWLERNVENKSGWIRARIRAAMLAERLSPIFEGFGWVQTVILFGSMARGDEHASSDYDFAIYVRDEYRLLGDDSWMMLSLTLSRELGCNVDIVDVTDRRWDRDRPDYFMKALAQEGIRIYERVD